MKRSIKMNMFFVLSGLILVMVLLYYITNAVFLEKYYTYKKISFMTSNYEHLHQLYSNNNNAFEEELNTLIYDHNINIFVYPQEDMTSGIFPRILTLLNSKALIQRSSILKKTEDYTIRKISLKKMSSEIILFAGNLKGNEKLIMYLPVASISSSAEIFNEFLLYVALAALIIGIVISIIMAEKLTKPITEISRMSENMKLLDFTGRYKGNRKDEIQDLGENMNVLSKILDNTITELKNKNNKLALDIHQKDRIEKMRKKFLQNASHQLKTPITIVKGYAEGLMDNVADDEESRINYASTIYKEAENMEELVMKILSLARLETDDYNLKLERFDINKLIDEVIERYAPLFEQRQIIPKFIHYDKVFAYADRNLISDVVSNYLTNAIHHVDENKEINISVSICKSYTRIEVYNSGKNIPLEEIENIWQSFYKLEHKDGYKGSGLGLSIVSAIMELHNCEYGVVNQNRGVVFWFQLGS
ncbi:sensor histidine kinase [Clostridium kluyveri]|uniref:histidine kinase n=1 Tax=Clostridium kluyveri TaxID=1534 RepID=A0A1L5F7B0_CLOKL|nr:HAMP domain-containing sensor histidine kinase [Clostridium kluyveri]APM38895.1 hypothetical protein BS101_09095 [Clostridium kluyveri]